MTQQSVPGGRSVGRRNLTRTLVITHGGFGVAALIGAFLVPDRTTAAVLLLMGVVILGTGVFMVLRVRRMPDVPALAYPPAPSKRRLIVQAVLHGLLLVGLVLLALAIFAVLPQDVAPWAFLTLVLVGGALDILRLIDALRAPTRPSVWWLVGYLPLPALLVVVGIVWITYPVAWIALALGLGWGVTLTILWARARSKAPLTNG